MTDKKEDKKADEAKTSPAPRPSRIAVRSVWLAPINGQVLLECNNDYRLIPADVWPQKKSFSLTQDEFKRLDEPVKFSIAGVKDTELWRAGIVSRSQQFLTGAVQQALHYSEAKISPAQLIAMLNLKE